VGQEEVPTEVEDAGQPVDYHDADSGRRIVDVWQAGGVGVGCDGDHDYVEVAVAVAVAVVAVVAVVGVGVGVGVAVEENRVAGGPLSVSHVGTQAAGLRWVVVVVGGYTVAGSQRTVDRGCTAVAVEAVEVEPGVVGVDIVVVVVVEDEYVFAASACLDHHNRSLHTEHFVLEVALVAAEQETIREYKLQLPVAVAVVAAAAELQPNKRNNLQGRQVVDQEEGVVVVGCTSAAG